MPFLSATNRRLQVNWRVVAAIAVVLCVIASTIFNVTKVSYEYSFAAVMETRKERKNRAANSITTTRKNEHRLSQLSPPSFEIVMTLLDKKTPSWSGRVDKGDFLLTPELADTPVTIFSPDQAINSSQEVIIPPESPFPDLALNRPGAVTCLSIRASGRTQEVPGYLHFIVSRYDNLPDVSIFIHSGPERHGSRILESIRHVVDHWTPEQVGFLHLNNEILVCRAVKRSEEWHDIWMSIGLNGSHHPNFISLPCCAQFMVSKERILLHPKSFYQHYLNVAYEWASGDKGYSLALFAEYHWHLLFGEPSILSQDRQVIHYLLSKWKKSVHPAVLYNPIPSFPYSDSMKPWYDKSVADPVTYFQNMSTNSHEACPPDSRFAEYQSIQKV